MKGQLEEAVRQAIAQARAQSAPAPAPSQTFGMSAPDYARFTSGGELPPDEAYRLREMKMASILGTPPPGSASPVAAPEGINPGLYQAMVASGAKPFEPPAQAAQTAPAALPAVPAPQQPPAAPPPPVSLPAPNTAPAPAMPAFIPPAQISPASPAAAHINNNVSMPEPTFTPAAPRPALPTFSPPQNLAPNLGAYAPAPSMPGYGMPRLGTPFKAPAPQGLLTFASFGGLPSYSTQPTAQQPDENLYGGFAPGTINGRQPVSLFSRY